MSTRDILGVDPGGTTGVCILRIGDEHADAQLITAKELTFPQLAYFLYEEMETVDAVAIERFTIGPQTISNSKAGAIAAMEAIGCTKAMIALKNPSVPLMMQSPSTAKMLADNDTLRTLGVWTKGTKGHALDATRHAVLYAVSQGWRPEGLTIPG